MRNIKQTACNPLNPAYHGEIAKGFTLVELIVVVTILAILATIGFVSYSSYLTGVRDTNRLAQLVSIHDGLTLYSTSKDLPLPDDNIEVKIGTSEVIGYQGFAGSNTLETIDFTKGGVDPKDNSYFTYYLTKDRKFFQLMAFLEEELDNGVTAQNVVTNTQAVSYDSRIVTTYGKELGVLTDTSNTPVQDLGSSAIDLSATTTDYRAYFDDETMFEGSGAELAAKVTLHVEHTSGFEPSDVSGLYMWFDANDSTTIEKTTGNVITKWNDKSNNNNHFDVIEGDPTYGDFSINGSKTVYFDGTDSMHTTATFNAPYTIMYVAQMEGTQNGRVLGGDGNTLISFYGGNSGKIYLGGWVSSSSFTKPITTEPLLSTFSMESGPLSKLYEDGQEMILQSPTAGNGNFGALWIGRAGIGEFSKVYMAEIVIFDRVILDNERKKIEAYLNKKWGPF